MKGINLFFKEKQITAPLEASLFVDCLHGGQSIGLYVCSSDPDNNLTDFWIDSILKESDQFELSLKEIEKVSIAKSVPSFSKPNPGSGREIKDEKQYFVERCKKTEIVLNELHDKKPSGARINRISGLECAINNRSFQCCLQDGNIHLLAFMHEGHYKVTIRGVDICGRYTWCDTVLKENETIRIKIIQMSEKENSKPESYTPFTREEIEQNYKQLREILDAPTS